MPLNVPASQTYLRNLKCAYTGKPIKVLMVSAGEAPPRYFSPDAFDPSDVFETSAELFAQLGTRDGIRGAAKNGAELVCPYTGEQMSVQKVPACGFQAVGGFHPMAPMDDPIEFARAMMTRNGVAPKDAPKKSPPPKASLRTEAETDESPAKLGDAALMASEGILKNTAPGKMTLTVPGRARQGKSTS
jgi:hypothetical protein